MALASPSPDNTIVHTITRTIQPSIPSDSPQFVSTKTFTSAILNSTNFFREEHNATTVNYNETLAQFAQDYLDDNDNDNPDSCPKFKHSGGPYGENLALGCSDVQSCVDAWGNERDQYDFGDPGFDHETGHFTQLVWKNTTDVGCGRKLCDKKGWYLVCEYWPRGNVLGQFGDAVQAQVSAATHPWAGGMPIPASLMAVLLLVVMR
ncbi:CAP domain-containing protein [Apodospora peruviana]|uniref:CAP domain-containing protein n=1 Tax=Apodospora peruviana TaxID=516989 RepID=A0AAE0HZU8_9PEZI|nr:CAP domain-containing protein [Apodospora peruviana]